MKKARIPTEAPPDSKRRISGTRVVAFFSLQRSCNRVHAAAAQDEQTNPSSRHREALSQFDLVRIRHKEGSDIAKRQKKSTLGSGTEAANGDSRRASCSPPVTSRKRRRKSVIFSLSMARRKAAADRPKKLHGASQPAANAGKLFSSQRSGL